MMNWLWIVDIIYLIILGLVFLQIIYDTNNSTHDVKEGSGYTLTGDPTEIAMVGYFVEQHFSNEQKQLQ